MLELSGTSGCVRSSHTVNQVIIIPCRGVFLKRWTGERDGNFLENLRQAVRSRLGVSGGHAPEARLFR